jgi:trimeric autotransporter adhesin
MQRFFGLVILLFFAMPFGLSVAGCGHKNTVVYCSGDLESGPTTGQVQTITLAANLAISGESLNYGQIGNGLQATAADCNGNTVSVSGFTYASTDLSIADVKPTDGTVCAGSWNRNSGGGVADYTICTAPAAPVKNHIAYITASANGATSNPIAVYIHPSVTSVALGNPSTDCVNDPASNCKTTVNNQVCNQSGVGTVPQFDAYDGKSCVSQNQSRQLTARVYDGAGNNITCQVGPISFALQGATNVAAINASGFATANQPGSAIVTATVSNSSNATNSGFFSTCPPASIQLAAANQPAGATNINVAINTPQSFTATVLDTLGQPITGLNLEFNSTLPVNFPASAGSVTAAFPGTATITAACIPPSCNPSPFSQIGVLGNGKPITSNGITVTAPGTSASVLYMASTPSTTTVNGNTVTNLGSQYIVSEDFTTGQLSSPIKLPYVPNSMVISQDGSTLYLGSAGGMMVVSATSNTLANTFTGVQGTVLAVAPNNSYVVTTDPTRQTVNLVTPTTGAIFSSQNGIGTRAAWTPDSNTLYVTATVPASSLGTSSSTGFVPVLLTYSTFTPWEVTQLDQNYRDVAVTVPAVGAYFAGFPTEARSYCSTSTFDMSVTPFTATNTFSPIADTESVSTDRLTATTDGKHILGASAAAPATLYDLSVNFPQPQGAPPAESASPLVCTNYPSVTGATPFQSSPASKALTGVTATSITGVVAASNSGSAFVTYTGSGSVLPLYQPGSGALSNVSLSGTATAPVAGVFSSDDTTFYAGTSGDNQVHVISVNGANSKDSGVITPNLPDPNGGIATPNLIAQRVRRTTS